MLGPGLPVFVPAACVNAGSTTSERTMRTVASHDMNHIRRSVSCKQFGGLQVRGTREEMAIVGRDPRQNRESCVLQANGPQKTQVGGASVVRSVQSLRHGQPGGCLGYSGEKGISHSLMTVARAVHANTHTHLCDLVTSNTASGLTIQQGVRQGSVEGLACFIMVYDEALKRIENMRTDKDLEVTFDSELKTRMVDEDRHDGVYGRFECYGSCGRSGKVGAFGCRA